MQVQQPEEVHMRVVLTTAAIVLILTGSADARARHRHHGGASLSGVVSPLASKARQIVSACGSRVISGVRHTRVRGTGRMSLHASGRAVDLAGNPRCIYAHLRGWPGGYSTDYGRVHHVHVSYGGREHGRRFVHGGGRHVRHRRYAARW